MAGGYTVRLGDGSEIGPMDLSALKTWYSQGLIDGDSPVRRPGSRNWETLGGLPEFANAAKKAKPKKAKRGAQEEAADEVWSEEPGRLDRWRVLAAGALLILAAAGFGFLAWRPETTLPAFDDAPWLQIALGSLALGLALVPGWELGRKGVRLVLMLVAFVLFPVAGILIAQGERGVALAVLGSVWLFVSGLAAFLGRAMGWARAALALLLVIAGAFGAVRFGFAPEGPEAQRVRQWATEEPRFSDDSLGVTLELPKGWVALKPGQTLVAVPAEAKVALAQPRLGGFGYLLAGFTPRGVTTAAQYLDLVAAQRKKERPGLQEGGRSNALIGTLSGQRLDASWPDEGTRYSEIEIAGKDGWMGFALVAWLPEEVASRTGGLDDLARGLTARGLLAARQQTAVQAVVDAVPHLSAPAAELLMAQSEARIIEPDQAFRRSVAALAKLLPSLTGPETRELTLLQNAIYAGVVWKDRTRLDSYIDRARQGETTRPEEDREMAGLMKAAELRLSPEQRLRLQVYYEKAIRALPAS